MRNLIILLMILSLGCGQESKVNQQPQESEEDTSVVPELEKIIFDSAVFDTIISDLKGIEKHYVQNSLYRLHSLLKFKNDNRFELLKNELEGRGDNGQFLKIELIDDRNGYIEFRTIDEENEEGVTMVYWNKTNGDKLIGQSQVYCHDNCFSELSFSLYNEDEKTYNSLQLREVIVEMDTLDKRTNALLDQKLREEKKEDGGIGTEFILPQKGKNIQYCIQEDCIELIWNDGIFIIAQ